MRKVKLGLRSLSQLLQYQWLDCSFFSKCFGNNSGNKLLDWKVVVWLLVGLVTSEMRAYELCLKGLIVAKGYIFSTSVSIRRVFGVLDVLYEHCDNYDNFVYTIRTAVPTTLFVFLFPIAIA